MIIRIVVVDPDPPEPHDDVLVYQVPENSRAMALLIQLLQDSGIEHTTIESPRKKRVSHTQERR